MNVKIVYEYKGIILTVSWKQNWSEINIIAIACDVYLLFHLWVLVKVKNSYEVHL